MVLLMQSSTVWSPPNKQHEKATLTQLLHTPCRSRKSASGHPPSQDSQKCTQCKQDLAAKWFAIKRSNLSGRRIECRLGPLSLTPACLVKSVCYTSRPGHLQIPRSHAACYLPHSQGASVNHVLVCVDPRGNAGKFIAGRVHQSTSRNVGQPCAISHQPCQLRRSAEGVMRYAYIQLCTSLKGGTCCPLFRWNVAPYIT